MFNQPDEDEDEHEHEHEVEQEESSVAPKAVEHPRRQSLEDDEEEEEEEETHGWRSVDDSMGEADLGTPPARRTLSFPQEKLFGRDHELEQLDDIFHRFMVGQLQPSSPSSSTPSPLSKGTTDTHNLQIALLEGYSGVGKSALVAEFLKRNLPVLSSSHHHCHHHHHHHHHHHNILFCSGKYNEPSRNTTTTFPNEEGSKAAADTDTDADADTGANRANDDTLEDLPLSTSSSVPFSGIAQALTMLAVHTAELLQEEEEEFTGKPTTNPITPSTLYSTIVESTDEHNEDPDADGGGGGAEVWSDSLLPQDIQLLVDIAPGLAPFLQTTSFQTRPRQSPSNGTWQNDLDQVRDDSIRTLVTSNLQSSASVDSTSTGRGKSALPLIVTVDVPQIATVVATFLRIILKTRTTKEQTHGMSSNDNNSVSTTNVLVFFLDDLQWIDPGSMELLEHLWKDPSLPPWMFIGALRTTPVPTARQEQLGRALSRLNRSITDQVVHRIPVGTLSPTQVLWFVAETLDKRHPGEDWKETKELEDLEPLAQFVYSRTLGNIFFCRQVLEALVRRNIIYFDVMLFEWKFNLQLGSAAAQNGQDLWMIQNEMDVVYMVQDQLKHLNNPKLRQALIVAASIRHTIDTQALWKCIQAVSSINDESLYSTEDMTHANLVRLLETAVEQGLLLKTTRASVDPGAATHTGFQFAHDRVQEAAYGSIPPGDTRNQLRAFIGQALLQFALESNYDDHVPDQEQAPAVLLGNEREYCCPEKEWMLFVAVDHLNSLPMDQLPCDLLKCLHANYLVGTLCLFKASFEQAAHHFRVATKYQRLDDSARQWGNDSSSLWSEDYGFCLALYNRLLETEFALGHYEEASKAIEAVLEHATSNRDKADAYYTRIQMIIKQNDNNHCLGAIEGAKLLTELGHPIPENPTAADIFKERLRYQMALGAKPISSIATLPMMEDDWLMKLLSQLIFISNIAGYAALSQFASLRALRLSLEQGVSKYLLIIMTDFTTPMRREGKYQAAYSYAAVVHKLYERFPKEKGSEYATSRLILHSGMLPLKEAFADSMDALLANYRTAMAAGNVDIALTSAMHFPLIYFASGLPLNALLEPKIILFQSKSQQLGRLGFVAIFRLCRQFVCQLQGKHGSGRSSALDMTAPSLLSEDQIIADLQGNSRKMTLRDSGILRVFLAYIMGDETTMMAMTKRLEYYPLFDLPLVRQHLRLTFHGLAALTLGRKRRDKQLLGQGQAILKELRKLESIGSLNARPVYLCLRAVEKHRRAAYEEAIGACSEARLPHLEAMMNEQCGVMLLEEASKLSRKRTNVSDAMISSAHGYLENALWLYSDWGAEAKVAQLKGRYEFLIPSSFHGSTAGKSSITTLFFQPSQRFDSVTEDPDDIAGQEGINEPRIRPTRSGNIGNYGPPAMPTRSASPARSLYE